MVLPQSFGALRQRQTEMKGRAVKNITVLDAEPTDDEKCIRLLEPVDF